MLSELVQKMGNWKADRFIFWKTFTESIPTHQSLIREAPIHVCALCGRSRSRRYQTSHPLVQGQVAIPGICTRPTCAEAQSARREFPHSRLFVLEVHHYY